MIKRVACVAALAALTAGLVVADIAMPRGKWAPIRMASENVKIVLGPAKVKVEATFILENEKDAATVVVGYPRGVLEKSLEDFAVTVDGEKAAVGSQISTTPHERREGADVGGKPGEPQKYLYQFDGPYPEWKTFPVKFDAKQKRTVVVSYSVAPAEVETELGKRLTYVYTMKTGATWSGNIDKAVIATTLDGVAMKDLVSVTPKSEAAAGQLIWTFTDFKPTQDIEITFKAPK
jgi:hypothetical protein